MSQGMVQMPLQSDVAGDGPDALAALVVLGALDALRIHLDARTLHLFDLLDDIELDARLVVDIAVGVVHRNDLCAQALRLLAGVDGDVARARDDDRLAFEAVAAALERLCRHVDEAVARCLGARKAAAVGKPSAREHADVLVADALVLTEEEADLSAAHADVARGNVGILPDVAVKLGHEALAEAHDLVIALALGVEIAAALAAADGKTREAVLEDLLEP